MTHDWPNLFCGWIAEEAPVEIQGPPRVNLLNMSPLSIVFCILKFVYLRIDPGVLQVTINKHTKHQF